MDSSYRCLTGALALGAFTVTALVDEADVKPATARTFLNRHRDHFSVDAAPSGRRGGQPQIWTIRPDSRPVLEAMVQDLDIRFTDEQEPDLELNSAGELASRSTLRLRVPSSNPELATSDDLDVHLLQPSIHLLPNLVERLLLATPGLIGLSIAVGEGIGSPGYDGRVEMTSEELFAPAGHSVWEFGAGGNPRRKADADLKKRSENPGDIDPTKTTFVFVTTRRFNDHLGWAKAAIANHEWKSIRVVDAEDLYAWALKFPAVHIWLSAELGLHPNEVITLSSWFEQWRRQTKTPVPRGVVTAGRRTEIDALRQAASSAGVIGVFSNSRQESRAFIAEALSEAFGDEQASRSDNARLASALLVRSPQEWSRLTDSLSDGILIPDFPSADVTAATQRGLTVVVPLGLGNDRRRATIDLPRIDLLDAAEKYVASGLGRNDAELTARSIDRSLTAYRRSDSTDPNFDRPLWAEADSSLIGPLVLLGSWNADTEADQSIVAEFTGIGYHEVDQKLRMLASKEDPPLFRSGPNWQISSPQDAFVLVEGAITTHLLDAWLDTAIRVLGESDPTLDISPDELLFAASKGIQRVHSAALREGIARGAILLGVFGEPAHAIYADRLVMQLLGPSADACDWKSLASVLPDIAEAAPDAYLNAVTDALTGDNPILRQMFTDSGPPPILNDRSPHTSLLWSIELLCRAPEYASRGCYVLSQLAAIDPGGRLGNRPFDSLRRVLLPWLPQIAATNAQRVEIVSAILDRHPDIGWQLLLSLLPGLHDSTHPTHSPRFRPWRTTERIPMAEQYAGWKSLTELAINAAVEEPRYLVQLLDTLHSMHPDDRAEFLRALGDMDDGAWRPELLLDAWTAVSDLVAKHRQFPTARWVLPDTDLEVLEKIADTWAPEDPVSLWVSLFSASPAIPFPRFDNHDKYQEEVDRLQGAALKEIISSRPTDGLIRLIEVSKEPYSVGLALGRVQRDQVADQMKSWVGRDDNLADAARGWLSQMGYTSDPTWISSFFSDLATSDDQTRLKAYQTLPHRDEVLDLIRNETPEIQREFWQHLGLMRSDRTEEVVAGFLQHERPRKAISYLAHTAYDQILPHDLVLRVLREAVASSLSDPLGDASISYEIGMLLDQFEQSGGDEELLAELEWTYFGILEHSRPSRALFRKFEREPEQYVELVCIVYRGDDELETKMTEEYDPQVAARWRACYSVLREWRQPPGTLADGSIDQTVLREWIVRVRQLLSDANRTDIGDECIGQLLSGTAQGADGIWPPEPVRYLLEEFNGSHVRDGIEIGRFNSRGVTMRGAFEGGQQERALAATYDDWSLRVAAKWPNTARILRDLARRYEEWAQREDARDEQWRDGR